jgi:hypothetical protein
MKKKTKIKFGKTGYVSGRLVFGEGGWRAKDVGRERVGERNSEVFGSLQFRAGNATVMG